MTSTVSSTASTSASPAAVKRAPRRPSPSTRHEDALYEGFHRNLQAQVDRMIGKAPVFETDADADEMWNVYLSSFSAANRQHYNCRTCRAFIKKYGGLVAVDPIRGGVLVPVLWGGQVGGLKAAVALDRYVSARRVTGVFLSEDARIGTPRTGDWTHPSVKLPAHLVHKGVTQTAFQKAAEKRQDYETLSRALGLPAYRVGVLTQVVELLSGDALYRSEKVLGQAEFLLGLARIRADRTVSAEARRNRLWRAIGQAPAGFCHPKAGMIGTLLEDLEAGLPFAEVSRRFAEKMHPLAYLRPSAAPKAGTIAQAEKVVAALDAEGALRRRFALLSEVVGHATWTPPPMKRRGGVSGQSSVTPGAFGHLTPREASRGGATVVGLQTMTWVKFRDTVLPRAERVTYRGDGVTENFTAMLTEAVPGSTRLFQWDNPVNQYVYNGGSLPRNFDVPLYEDVEVKAVIPRAHQWNGGNFPHQAQGVTLILAGAHDMGRPGLCLFPENLRAEFHGVRSVLEAHSRSRQPEAGGYGQHAAGIALDGRSGSGRGGGIRGVLSVLSNGVLSTYRIDRWD
jgi:hypothetical protein